MALHDIALYGGTFDPIHIGHLIAGRSVMEQLGLERLIFVPSARPPHKGGRVITPFHHRAEMLRLAVAGEHGLDLDERESRRQGPSYTLDTVLDFKRDAPGRQIHWIIGADSLPELRTWHRVTDLIDACNIVTVCRPGWEAPDLSALGAVVGPDRLQKLRLGILETPRIDVASSQIRARVSLDLSIRYLVPESVREYIELHQLYR